MAVADVAITETFRVIDLIGVLANAVLGGVVARAERLDPVGILTALAGAAIAFVVRIEGRAWDRSFPYVDALALGCWAAVGAQRTLVLGLGWLPAVLLGTITAVGGGMVRDVVLRRIPAIFGGTTLYATSALAASGVMVVLYRLGHPTTGLVAATLTGAGLTLLARWRGWHLPEAYVWQPRRRRRRRRGGAEP